jgi:uncharacterized protein YyaL (SSP411 family)
VDWYPWGEEALQKARTENKLIIVSIGYAACHWWHVMEHESFEDQEVADFMNEHFVSIKVDREERPDIDQIYMQAVQMITQHGGWPLNCICLPDTRPVYGGTYFPRKQWLELLSAVFRFVRQHPDKAEETAQSLVEGVNYEEILDGEAHKKLKQVDYRPDLDTIFTYWKSSIDFVYGGSVGAPKFPMPKGYEFLLFYYYLSQNEQALKAVLVTLDKMASGGIYDQIGGGFARYSTDVFWKVPHFEKMLYDNAQLVSLYLAAFQATKDENYKRVLAETLDFIKRELTSPEGFFYSSLDADSEGVEGKFYVWKTHEIQELLDDEASLMMEYYNITQKGNWENSSNILFKAIPDKEFAHKHKITIPELNERIFDAKEILLKQRAKRIRPMLDDKVITAWNALMIKGYADAYRVLDDPEYLQAAIRCAELILIKSKTEGNRLFRNYKNGKSSVNAFLDDYAFVISAFISLYQATFDERWIHDAHDFLKYTLSHFYSPEGIFYYTSDQDPGLIARKMEIHDNVIPSSNSEMAKNLYMLGHYFPEEEYLSIAGRMLDHVKPHLGEGGIYYANWDIVLGWMLKEPYEIAIVGNECELFRKEFDQRYLPNAFFYGGTEEGSLPLLKDKLKAGKTTIYVCRNKICQLPVTDVPGALKQLI